MATHKIVNTISKIEMEDDLALETTELKNVVLVIQDYDNCNSLDQLQFISNSDGNLEINSLNTDVLIPMENVSQQAEEEVHEGEGEPVSFDDGEYIQHDNEDIVDEDLLNNTEVVEEYIVRDTFVETATNQYEKQDDGYQKWKSYKEADDVSMDSNFDFQDTSQVEDDVGQNETKDEEHPCSLCQRVFKSAASLKRHVTVTHAAEEEEHDDPLAFELCLCCAEPLDSAHTTGDFKCEHCDKLFLHHSSLLRHCSMEHSKDGAWRCVECNKLFPERNLLLEHMVTHPFNKTFVCRHCEKEFTRKYHLDRHMSQTGCDGNPPVKFECQVCNKVFSRKDNLREHLRAHAGQSKPRRLFLCTYCDKEFKGSSLLIIHLRTHTGERPYACDFCPKRFPSSGAMKKHRRMHTGEKPYECPKCSNTFAAKETLNRHVRTHTGEKPHSCHFCGKTFIQAAQLRAHIFHHTGENGFTCPKCNRTFNRRNRLTQHMKFVHEGANPLQCEHCDRTFFRREDLVRHGNLHSGIKPYVCELCKKSFAIKSSLKIHMLTHRKEDPCSCDECGRAFIRQDCLMRHMRFKHRDVLEDIMASAEKKRLQQQLLNAASDAAKNGDNVLGENSIWNELSLTDSVKELLSLLVDESTLKGFGWPEAPVDKLLDSVIKRCGHKPASKDDFDYLGRMRENVKLLFTVVIDDEAVKSLLNNQTVDEVIVHVLNLSKMN